MQRRTSKPTDCWATLLKQEMIVGTRGRPEGEEWKTVYEFADENHLSRSHANNVLLRLLHEGKVESTRSKIGHRLTKFYRPTP